MGKKFYIGEIQEETLRELEEYGLASIEITDGDVIDGDRLRYDYTEKGTTYFWDGWRECGTKPANNINRGEVRLILDPPKEPEGDEWEKWVEEMPKLPTLNEMRFRTPMWTYEWRDFVKNWLRKMPRGK